MTRQPNEDDFAKAQIAHTAFAMAAVAELPRQRYAYLEVGCSNLRDLFQTEHLADQHLKAVHIDTFSGIGAVEMEMRECALDCLCECLQKAASLARKEATIWLDDDERSNNGAVCASLMRIAAQWTRRAGYQNLTPGLLAASGVSMGDLNLLLLMQAEQAVPAPRPPSSALS